MSEILQKHLSFAPWTDSRTRRLPGTIPVTEADWLVQDDAFARQLELREKLIAERPHAVHRLSDECLPAAHELYDWFMRLLPGLGYEMGEMIRRPDGGLVAADRDAPLLTLGRLVAEDLCLMVPGAEGEHVLGGAILCFPAGWTLEQKFMRPMMRIHKPVAKYTEEIGRRVQRLLDGIRPEIGMMRGTAHHSNAPLHNPRSEEQGRAPQGPLPFIRVERQCLFRLPQSGAVVFSIHTAVIREGDLTAEQLAALREFPIREAA
ncbi:heme-dependent oxidative N-demethylase family protein [Paracoccus ravus]|uniref:heme-dependent oxidative N-demethylase family protein n=1 Tax=Paracoccus ravus TaxID=2447760 RepID=UPI00106E55B8|nr:DUF3445 domain-containing protein [Paracoccus ravus]